MYKFKTNKETKELEMIKEGMNIHSSVLAKKDFEDIFTREFARFEFFSLQARIDNGNETEEDATKYNLLSSEFNFDYVSS